MSQRYPLHILRADEARPEYSDVVQAIGQLAGFIAKNVEDNIAFTLVLRVPYMTTPVHDNDSGVTSKPEPKVAEVKAVRTVSEDESSYMSNLSLHVDNYELYQEETIRSKLV